MATRAGSLAMKERIRVLSQGKRYERKIRFDPKRWTEIRGEIDYGLDVDNFIIITNVDLNDRIWYGRITAAAYDWQRKPKNRGLNLLVTTAMDKQARTISMWAG